MSGVSWMCARKYPSGKSCLIHMPDANTLKTLADLGEPFLASMRWYFLTKKMLRGCSKRTFVVPHKKAQSKKGVISFQGENPAFLRVISSFEYDNLAKIISADAKIRMGKIWWTVKGVL